MGVVRDGGLSGTETGGFEGKRYVPRHVFPVMSPRALMRLGPSGSTAGSVLMALYLVPMALYCVFCVLLGSGFVAMMGDLLLWSHE
jgi:hypothetical protein